MEPSVTNTSAESAAKHGCFHIFLRSFLVGAVNLNIRLHGCLSLPTFSFRFCDARIPSAPFPLSSNLCAAREFPRRMRWTSVRPATRSKSRKATTGRTSPRRYSTLHSDSDRQQTIGSLYRCAPPPKAMVSSSVDNYAGFVCPSPASKFSNLSS